MPKILGFGVKIGDFRPKNRDFWGLEFIANVMTRALDSDTTSADNAFLKNSVDLFRDAVS